MAADLINRDEICVSSDIYLLLLLIQVLGVLGNFVKAKIYQNVWDLKHK